MATAIERGAIADLLRQHVPYEAINGKLYCTNRSSCRPSKLFATAEQDAAWDWATHVADILSSGSLDGRPDVLASRAQALDRVQELIAPDNDGPWVDPPLPTQEQWKAIVSAAFPPPPMAGA